MINELMSAAGIESKSDLSDIIKDKIIEYVSDKKVFIYSSPKMIASCYIIQPGAKDKSIRVSDLILDLMGVFDNSVVRSLIRRQGLGKIDESLGEEIGGRRFEVAIKDGFLLCIDVETLQEFDLIELLNSGLS